MARAIDYVAFTLIIFLLTLTWTTSLFKQWAPAIIFACAVALIAAVTVRYISRGRRHPYSHERLAAELCVRGPAYLIGLLLSTVKDRTPESAANYIILDDCILFAAFRFTVLNVTELNNLITTAVSHGKKDIYVMTRGVNRRAFQLLQFYDVKIKVVKIRAVYRYLAAHDALPDLKPVKKKFSLAALADAVFQRGNLKNYMFSGFILIAVSFLTPLRIYYIVLGSISLVMALLTLTPLGRGAYGGGRIFDKLSAAGTSDNTPENCCGKEELTGKSGGADGGTTNNVCGGKTLDNGEPPSGASNGEDNKREKSDGERVGNRSARGDGEHGGDGDRN